MEIEDKPPKFPKKKRKEKKRDSLNPVKKTIQCKELRYRFSMKHLRKQFLTNSASQNVCADSGFVARASTCEQINYTSIVRALSDMLPSKFFNFKHRACSTSVNGSFFAFVQGEKLLF